MKNHTKNEISAKKFKDNSLFPYYRKNYFEFSSGDNVGMKIALLYLEYNSGG
jgi:hypothetical protein